MLRATAKRFHSTAGFSRRPECDERHSCPNGDDHANVALELGAYGRSAATRIGRPLTEKILYNPAVSLPIKSVISSKIILFLSYSGPS